MIAVAVGIQIHSYPEQVPPDIFEFPNLAISIKLSFEAFNRRTVSLSVPKHSIRERNGSKL